MPRKGGVKSFTQIALEHGLATEDQVDACERIQSKARKEDQDVPSLEDIMLERGFMNETEVHHVRVAIGRFERDEEREEPNRIGGYEIMTKIGDGGLGSVYRARQITMGRVVALKVLHKMWLSDEEFKKRFLLEARLVGRLSHQNLIQVIDVGKDQGQYYFSMEFIDGQTVEQMIDDNGAVPLDQALDIIVQVLRAIKYIWRHKIVHRDIKPGNIMISRRGTAKLGDFGFVKSKFDSILSTEGEVLGTPDYIAPEVAMGEENIDFRSDIYSLGITLYHMVTGRPPYSGTGSQVMRQHITAELPSPKDVNADIPDQVCHIIEKMTAKEPEDRYAELDELFQDFEMVRVGRNPVSDRPDAGKSTILRAFKVEHTRADKLSEDLEAARRELEAARKRLNFALIALGGLAGLVVLLLIMQLTGGG
jgi:serine/threonine protein kinase